MSVEVRTRPVGDVYLQFCPCCMFSGASSGFCYIVPYLKGQCKVIASASESASRCSSVSMGWHRATCLLCATLYPDSLRSANRGQLDVPRTTLSSCGVRAFAHAGPSLWNTLPVHLKNRNLTLTTFMRHLKSVWPHLFCGAGHEKRRGEQLEWSLRLGCTSEVSFSMCTAIRTSSYSPVGPSVFYLA